MSTHQAEILDLRYRPPKNELGPQFVPSGTGVECQDVAATTSMNCFRLSDEKAVCEYLHDRLLLLQQQAGKRIAKLWIKGICPKKQARYPYRSKQQRQSKETDPLVPEWWPIDLCSFTEPDHVDKKSRMNLCLHLLRLRPSLQQLKQWNADLQGPNKTLETRGWTAFLQELTPSTTLDGLGKSPESEEKVKQRQKIMNDMYEIAEKEEAFIKGERDDDLIYYENEDDPTVSTNKSHVKKRAADGREVKSSDTVDRRQKKRKHAAVTEPLKRKRGPAKTGKIEMVENRARSGPGSMSWIMYPEQNNQTRASKARCKPIKPSNMRLMQTRGNLTVEYPLELMSHWASMNQATSSQESSPMTSSFCSSHSSHDDMRDAFQFFDAPTNFPGQRDFKFEESTQQHNTIHVHNVEIPQPYFETVPNTPVMSPSKCTPFPQGSVWSGRYHIAPAIERYPQPLSTAYMSAVTAPAPASQPPVLASSMPYAHGPFVEHRDQRSITPASDVQSAYEGFPSIEYGEHRPHGLPVLYRRDYPIPDENSQPLPFEYPEPTPNVDFPAAALPGSVTRGFTGTSSGVSGGAWT